MNRKNKNWSEHEDNIIKKYYYDTNKCVKLLGRTKNSISHRRRKLDIKLSGKEIGRLIRPSKIGNKNPNWIGGRTEYNCFMCNYVFYSYDNRKYCSQKCMGENTSGIKSPHWKGGTKKLIYGDIWTRKFRLKIRIRDNYTCQICKIEGNKKPRDLHIHHIDDNKFNNSMKNLITLCPRCHGEQQGINGVY